RPLDKAVSFGSVKPLHHALFLHATSPSCRAHQCSFPGRTTGEGSKTGTTARQIRNIVLLALERFGTCLHRIWTKEPRQPVRMLLALSPAAITRALCSSYGRIPARMQAQNAAVKTAGHLRRHTPVIRTRPIRRPA